MQAECNAECLLSMQQQAAHLRVLAEEGWHQVFQENSPIVLSITDAGQPVARVQPLCSTAWPCNISTVHASPTEHGPCNAALWQPRSKYSSGQPAACSAKPPVSRYYPLPTHKPHPPHLHPQQDVLLFRHQRAFLHRLAAALHRAAWQRAAEDAHQAGAVAQRLGRQRLHPRLNGPEAAVEGCGWVMLGLGSRNHGGGSGEESCTAAAWDDSQAAMEGGGRAKWESRQEAATILTRQTNQLQGAESALVAASKTSHPWCSPCCSLRPSQAAQRQRRLMPHLQAGTSCSSSLLPELKPRRGRRRPAWSTRGTAGGGRMWNQ